MRRIQFLLALALLVVGLFAPATSTAQTDRRCFDAPGITNCIEGRFREYWEQNGGLAVFGYPLTPATMEQTAEGQFLTQYFERNRFELHPEKPRPYDVLLGRLGVDRLVQQNRNWRNFGQGEEEEGCLFFPETGHSLCNLESSVGFRSYWESHGLQDPALSPFQRSLALFGYPISELTVETNAAGDTVITQWFERARFEYHPGKPREFRVLLGRLGDEIRNPPPAPPVFTPQPPATDACAGIGVAVNAVVAPNCVPFGEIFIVGLSGFSPQQPITFSIQSDGGTPVGSEGSIRANAQGNASIFIDTTDYFGATLQPGNYVLTATAGQGGRATAPFRVIP